MNNILLIGSGGCGGKLLNTTINLLQQRLGFLKNSYDYLFVNSNKNEMSILENCKLGQNTLIINGDGTGKNRTKAKESIANDKINVTAKIDSLADRYSSAYILVSGDGGFGSGSINLLSKLLKQVNPKIAVNVLAAMPRKKSKKLSLENALSLYEDIKILCEKGLINSYQFIENDKMQDEEEFNLRAMSLFIESLEMDAEELDSNDSFIVNSAKGYKAILPINGAFLDIETSISKAISNSPFIIPDKMKGTHIYGLYNSDYYEYDDVFSQYEITEFDKLIPTKEKTIFVITGLANPEKYMSELNDAYEKLLATKLNDDIEEEFSFSKRRTYNSNETINKASQPFNKKQRLRAMMDDNFWD